MVSKVVSTGQTFIQSWEDLSIDIWAQQTGKSTSRVMPSNGTSTPRPSPAWKPCGGPGKHLRLDGATGISVWWKDYADHHMGVLLDPRGPFYKCGMQKHRDPEHLEP